MFHNQFDLGHFVIQIKFKLFNDNTSLLFFEINDLLRRNANKLRIEIVR